MPNGKIVRGRLDKLEDTDHPKFIDVDDGSVLAFNATTQKWEPQALADIGYDGKLGVPTDTTYSDGLLDLTPDTLVKDAVDEVNEILSELAPLNALTIAAVAFTGGLTKYIGKVPSGLTTGNWGSLTPGVTVNDGVISLTGDILTGNVSTTFNYADQGVLELYANGSKVASIDLATNFVEANRTGNQSMSDYDVTGSGDPITNGVVNFSANGVAGTFTLISVGKYNNFKRWQKGNAKIALTAAPGGTNTLYIKHVGITTPQQSANYTFTYDEDTTAITVSGSVITEGATVVGKFLSGIKYYTTGDQFNIDYTVNNLFRNLYKTSGCTTWELQDGITSKTVDPVSVPVYSDTFVSDINNVAVDEASVFTGNAVLKVNTYSPYGAGGTYTESGKERHVLTYGTVSTAVAESFKDEVYRLPLTFDFTSKTATYTNQWNSSTILSNGNAQCYLTGLQVPNKNYNTAAVTPAQATDYSSFSGVQKYARAFIGTTKPSIQFTFNGMVGTLGQLGSGDINVEVKLPTQTAWLDAIKPYDSFAGVDDDGDGALAGSVSGGVFSVTFGGKNTVDSGDRVYVRITLRTATAKIGSISTNW